MVNSRLLCNRATALATKKDADHSAAIKDCDKAIYMDDTYQKAYLRRADCYMSLNGEDEKAEITKVRSSQSISQSVSPPLCRLLYFHPPVADMHSPVAPCPVPNSTRLLLFRPTTTTRNPPP